MYVHLSFNREIDMFQNIGEKEFQERMTSENVLILDVRTEGECKAGIIPGAIQRDIMQQQFKDQLAKLDQEKTYLVYCYPLHYGYTLNNL